MATAQTAETTAKTVKAPKTVLAPADLAKKRAARRRLKATGRKKLATKLTADKEFAKTYFEGRSKRAIEKKAAFRKKKTKKK